MADLSPKLLDFGLARPSAAAAAPAGPQAHVPGTIVTGRIVGSVDYMAPEVLEGHYSARSEIYSFGMVLLELCTLRPVATANALEEATRDGEDAGGLRRMMANPREEWPGGSLDRFLALINSCVQRRPERRPLSMRLVLVSLNNILRAAMHRDEPIQPLQPFPTNEPGTIDRIAGQLKTARATAAAEAAEVYEHRPASAVARAPDEQLVECPLCAEKVREAEGICCKAEAQAPRHFLCHRCLGQTVQMELGERGDLVVRNHCTVRCPSWAEGCVAEPWGPADLLGHLTPEVNLLYLERVYEMYVHHMQREQERRNAVQQEVIDRQSEEVGHHHNRIADLLLLKCPTCNRGFVDVHGCNAVSCRANGADRKIYGCGAVFCHVCFWGKKMQTSKLFTRLLTLHINGFLTKHYIYTYIYIRT